MSKKNFVILGLFAVLLTLSINQNAIAGADWQEKQKELFAKLGVKPGDVIDKSNWEKAKDIVPEPVVNWVKNGEWIIKVGEMQYDLDFTPEWYALSAKNKGKYGLGSKKEIIDLSTGKFPKYIAGMPFPDVDIKNDPDGAMKRMHNTVVSRCINGSYDDVAEPEGGNLQWVGKGGYERGIRVSMRKYYYWNRPNGEQPNPNDYLYTTSTLAHWPYDISGTAQLYFRYLDGRDDDVYAYVPAIRRVKRLSGANRSDPFMGADSTFDDQDGWDGQNESMTWSYIGETVMLMPKFEGDTKTAKEMKKNQQGAWQYYIKDGLKYGWEDKTWSGVPYAYVNAVWVPREMWIIKAVPKDPYYAYGIMEFYVDKLSGIPVFDKKYNKAGEYWKFVIYQPCMVDIPDPKYAATAHAFNVAGPLLAVDEKTHHAMCMPLDDITQIADSPRVNPRDFTPQNLRVLTK